MAKKPRKRKHRPIAYVRWMLRRDVTVKHVRADLGQKRVIYRALHETHQLNAGRRVQIAVVMCMTQESVCRALHGGDLDSVGPFQQRDPWGPASLREDAATSCRMFLTGGQGGQPGWNHYYSLHHAPPDLGEAVQRVQVSAYPGAYSQWESEASRTVDKFRKLNKTEKRRR